MATVVASLRTRRSDKSGLRAQCSHYMYEPRKHFLWHAQAACKPGIFHMTSHLQLQCAVFRRVWIPGGDLKLCWRSEHGALTCLSPSPQGCPCHLPAGTAPSPDFASKYFLLGLGTQAHPLWGAALVTWPVVSAVCPWNLARS